jgi:hypothetical protein
MYYKNLVAYDSVFLYDYQMEEPRLFAVVGCQRCGTTLMGLILSSNPNVRYYDEDGAYPIAIFRKREYQKDKPHIGFKLTTLTPETDKLINENPGMNFLFMTRDILDVCSSMLKLSWVIPSLLGEELQISINNLLPSPYRDWIIGQFLEFNYSKNAHKLAALYAQTRFNILHEYNAKSLRYFKVIYENLVEHSLAVIKEICEFLGIDYCSQMSIHHAIVPEKEIHGTKSRRKIDSKSVSKYREHLTERQIDDILKISSEAKRMAIPYYTCLLDSKNRATTAKFIEHIAESIDVDREILLNDQHPFGLVKFTKALSEREQVIVYLYELEKSYDEMAYALNADIESARMEVASLFMKNERLKEFLKVSGSPRLTIQRAHLLA